MRPKKLELQAFGSFPSRETVDFDVLSAQGPFLICGKTGSGKTTVLDAISFALYDRGCSDLRSDFESMRCQFAPKEVPTFVRFYFECGGQEYCFERKLELKRTQMSYTRNAFLKDGDGNYVPKFENCKGKMLENYAKELIGLDHAQFCQVFVLPQGKFETLLVSDSAKKEEILKQIFGLGEWGGIADRMFGNAKARLDDLVRKQQEIDARLLDDGCAKLEDLAASVDGLKEQLEERTEEYGKKDLDGELKRIALEKEKAARFRSLRAAEEALRRSHELDGETDALRSRTEEAGKANAFRDDLAEYARLKKDLEEREAESAGARKSRDEAEAAFLQAARLLEEHGKKEEENEERRRRLALFEGKEASYGNADRLKREENECRRALSDAEGELEEKKKELEGMKQQLRLLDGQLLEAQSEAQEYLRRYLSNVYGDAASRLKEGEPCPVCGSTEHPCPAPSVPDAVSEAEEKEKHREAEEVRKRRDAQKEKVDSFDLRPYEQKVNGLTAELAARHAAAEMTERDKIEGIASLAELRSAAEKLKAQTGAYDRQRKELTASRDAAGEIYQNAAGKAESAAENAEKAAQNLRLHAGELTRRLAGAGYPSPEAAASKMMAPGELTEARERISAHDSELKTLRAALEERKREAGDGPEPDEKSLEDREAEIRQEQQEFSSSVALLNGEIRRRSEKLEKLEKEQAYVSANRPEAESDLSLCRSLRGDNGVGLQRYVLGIMFSSVIGAANRMLEGVHGGRYQLFRTDDRTGSANKRGLDLCVYDRYSLENTKGRPVGYLSGGEKFLVSLALSIGLSAVAQRSGIRLEGMFIDEGFGTLDSSSIGDAMGILEGLQKSSSVLGIISHVQVLRDAMPVQLQVIPREGGAGSTMRTVTG